MTNIVPLWPAQSHDMGPIQSPESQLTSIELILQ